MKTVMIIEDDRDFAEAVADLIHIEGGDNHKIIYAGSACEARTILGRLGDNTPNILLVDIGLPHVSGTQLHNMLHRDERYQHTKVILMSGEPTEDDRDYAERHGLPLFRKGLSLVRVLPELLQACA